MASQSVSLSPEDRRTLALGFAGALLGAIASEAVRWAFEASKKALEKKEDKT